MRLWVTRTLPGAEATAQRLKHLGHEPVVAPALAYRPLPKASLDLERAKALAFTSRNAVEAFAGLTDRRDLPVYANGGATAAAAREIGFSQITHADGGVANLAELILKAKVAGLIVWPGPTEPAGDLPAMLAGGGAVAELQPVYESVATGVAVPQAIDGVLIHSPKAARAVAKILSREQARGLALFAISPAAAAPLAATGFIRVAVAPRPNESALLDLLAG